MENVKHSKDPIKSSLFTIYRVIQSLNVHVTALAIIGIICCDQAFMPLVAKPVHPCCACSSIVGKDATHSTSTDLCRLRNGLGAENHLIQNTEHKLSLISFHLFRFKIACIAPCSHTCIVLDCASTAVRP